MCFKFLKKGFSQKIDGPEFGSQDKGITPGGPMDAFSMNTGNLLLEQDRWTRALEFISPPELLILNDAFIVLTGAPYERIVIRNNDKTSALYLNGTVQLTQSEPIILLKHRQTIGGYPRIFNVIYADVDLLGQYSPLQSIKFSEVSITKALNIKEKKNNILKNTI